jgi:hypothetical protein
MDSLNLVQTDQPGFMKDEKSGAIINVEVDHYKQILAKRKEKKTQQEMEKRMTHIEDQVSEILEILKGRVN